MADVTLSKTQITPSPGKTNSVTCTVTGETFRGWFKPDNTKVSTSKSDKIYVETTGNAHKLKLTDVKVSYGGTYECRGSLKTASLIVHVECKLLVTCTLFITNITCLVAMFCCHVLLPCFIAGGIIIFIMAPPPELTQCGQQYSQLHRPELNKF